MAKKPKKLKLGETTWTQNTSYKLPMTREQLIVFGKLKMSPKTTDKVSTLPKGAEKLSATEKSQMQKRRIADRKRTLARGEAIIRRTVGKPKIGGNQTTSKSTPKPKSKPKSTT